MTTGRIRYQPTANKALHPTRWGAGVAESPVARPGWARRLLVAVTELTVDRESLSLGSLTSLRVSSERRPNQQ
jgi:hypothetical protein